MTRKDYVAFANALAMFHEQVDLGGLELSFDELVNTIADVFKADNPRFDYARFKAAVYSPPAKQKVELLGGNLTIEEV